MIVNKQCACGQSVEFEAEQLDGLACPACGRSLKEQFARKPAAVPHSVTSRRINPAQSSPSAKLPSEEQVTLESVRFASCYQTLRSLVEVGIMLGYAVCALFAVGAAFMLVTNLVSYFTGKGGNENAVVAAAGALFGIAFAAVLLTALKEALLLGVDAVDILIADRTDRRARERRALDAEICAAEHARSAFEASGK